MTIAVIVVPCFNEADRLDPERVLELATDDTHVVLVDDGSTDGTADLLTRIAADVPARVTVLGLERNVGKGEAVRAGLLAALDRGPELVGYADADFATPIAELQRLIARAVETRSDMVLGSRVMLLGRSIRRRAARHYMGRVFATCASLVLRMPVYDTQCGAKVFRATIALRRAVSLPFVSRWGFDVELLGRLHGCPGTPPPAMREEPLEAWADIAGSKIGFVDGVRATLELLLVARSLERYRAGALDARERSGDQREPTRDDERPRAGRALRHSPAGEPEATR